ncbi:tRNA (Guanine-1)-methyltransferase domain-containing protein [Ditylenchus destructor]|nr:tRNA (Guanine-1)-methyltransferase domain-containing protein [Ditylenchus destructor]
MRLDSVFYRMLWNAKRVCGVKKRGPRPIVWGVQSKEFAVPSQVLQSLDDPGKRRLELIHRELQVLSRVSDYLPDKISDVEWKRLMKMDSTKERIEHVIFLSRKQMLRAKERSEKRSRKTDTDYDDDEDSQDVQNSVKDADNAKDESPDSVHAVAAGRTHYSCSNALLEKRDRQELGNRYLSSVFMDDTPKLIVDCRWLTQHSPRGHSLALKQLNIVLSNNRVRRKPWPLFFCNYNFNEVSADAEMYARQKFLIGMLDHTNPRMKLCGELTDHSYLDLFPEKAQQKKLIYLSPHAEEELELVKQDECYVLGGIVDRVFEPKIGLNASSRVAEEEGIVCKKLPLDKYIDWKSGHRMLTINGVADILQDVFDTNGDWVYALDRHIPVRNTRPHAEKNPIGNEKAELQREYNRELVRIVTENTNHQRQQLLEATREPHSGRNYWQEILRL